MDDQREKNRDQSMPKMMEPFPASEVTDWKHVLYNQMVQSFNYPELQTLVHPCHVLHQNKYELGFVINDQNNPKKRLAELFAIHNKGICLQEMGLSPGYLDDLVNYYYKCVAQIMAKYYTRIGPYTYIYDRTPLFIAGEDLDQARERLAALASKQRGSKRHTSDSDD
eukprot:TRINITY_DN4693_c0_g1_i1.p1 TRINITY_DN4693_c0_g1~~TRINITY_DN4693_c0_g1_i1.p1  ORF type:complete len:182 (-),score=10.18 TRINITY_DN4693_c0_g1_i1:163-663(-)